jgi:hypothetical protein
MGTAGRPFSRSSGHGIQERHETKDKALLPGPGCGRLYTRMIKLADAVQTSILTAMGLPVTGYMAQRLIKSSRPDEIAQTGDGHDLETTA